MKKDIHINTDSLGLDGRTLGFATVAALLGIGFAMAISTSAYADPKTREAERTALENRDYDAWLALHEDMPRASTVSEEDFDALVAMHEARLAGDYATVAEIRDELDLPVRAGFGGGRGMYGQGRMMDSEQHEAVEAALDAGDFTAWSELMDGRTPVRFVTEDDFDTFRALHEAMEDGDVERATELRDELGLPGESRSGYGRGSGHGSGRGAGMGPVRL